MREVFPTTYLDFRCIASECRHNCCIGWEIDIDEDTAAYYAALPGAMGERLRENIIPGEPPSFRLGADGRCPFLNQNNLCDLILTLGEDSLCEICSLHPRFRNWYGDRVEIGVGLCCEAAARLIMGQTEPFSLVWEAQDCAGDANLALRSRILRTLTDRSVALELRCKAVMDLCGGSLARNSIGDWAELFLSLEQLEPSWTRALQGLKAAWKNIDFSGFREQARNWETEYEQLLCYFIYRHFLNMSEEYTACAAAGFAVLSCGLIFCLHALHAESCGSLGFEQRTEYARQYSAEIEYSDVNPEFLLKALEKSGQR